jgi:hypothetical protein
MMPLSTAFAPIQSPNPWRALNSARSRATFNEIRDVGLRHFGQACPFPKRRRVAVEGRA